MLIGELPDLEETQSGKDLIAIGEKRGEKRGEKQGERRGKIESILRFLKSKHSKLPKELQGAIAELSTSRADQLLDNLPHWDSLEEVRKWLDNGQ